MRYVVGPVSQVVSNDKHLDPGNMFDEDSHADDCTDDECEGCGGPEPDYEYMWEMKYGS